MFFIALPQLLIKYMPKGLKHIRIEYSEREITQWLIMLKFRCKHPTFESKSYASYKSVASTLNISSTSARAYILAELETNTKHKGAR